MIAERSNQQHMPTLQRQILLMGRPRDVLTLRGGGVDVVLMEWNHDGHAAQLILEMLGSRTLSAIVSIERLNEIIDKLVAVREAATSAGLFRERSSLVGDIRPLVRGQSPR